MVPHLVESPEHLGAFTRNAFMLARRFVVDAIDVSLQIVLPPKRLLKGASWISAKQGCAFDCSFWTI
jgi:hypothetical protein